MPGGHVFIASTPLLSDILGRAMRADYIARVNGTRNYPWRAMIVAENDANLSGTYP